MTAEAFPRPGGPRPPEPAPASLAGAGIVRQGHSTPDPLTLFLGTIQNPETARHYGRAIFEFGQWRNATRQEFNVNGLSAWRNHLKQRGLSASTINQRLAAVRRLARQAAENGLIPAAQAASIAATRNVRQLGTRSGNWLSRAQAQALIEAPAPSTLKGKRDRAALALLVGCGLRREEAVRLQFEDIQQRDGRWVIPDLTGKHGHIRTVPVPSWVKVAVDRWADAAQIHSGTILRAVNRHGRITHDSLTGQAVFELAALYGRAINVELRPHDLRRTCAKLCRANGGELEQIQLLLGHASIQTTERYLGTKQDLTNAPNDRLGLKWRDQ